MRDEEIREPEGLLQVPHQVRHLGGDGDVEGGKRLVGHDELGLESEHPGDRDPPLLAAREIGGISRKLCRLELDEREKILRPAEDAGKRFGVALDYWPTP